MKDRVIQSVDEGALREELVAVLPGFRADADEVRSRANRLRGHILEADRRIWSHDVGMDRYVSR
jgi:guanine deaminase